MSRIAEKAECSMDYWKTFTAMQYDMTASVTNAISHATCTTALDLKAAVIITVTQSGQTARMISRFRPACSIIATTTSPRVQRQLSMSWGVIPYLVNVAATTYEKINRIVTKRAQNA